MKRFNGIVGFGLALAGLALATGTPASAQSGKAYFKGKSITYTAAAGGGHDFYARLMAHHMKRYLPGAKFAVINKPGAGHMIGTNLIYISKPNGLTIGTFSTVTIAGKKTKRTTVKVGMTCTFTYPRPGAESKNVDCQ